MSDIMARAMAAGIRAALNGGTSRKSVAFGIVGQSNEHGAIPLTDASTWPLAFASVHKPGDMVPHYPAITRQGGWWSYVQDALWDWGYDTTIVNGAIGSASLILDYAGFFYNGSTRNYTGFRERRPANSWNGDTGFVGDLTLVSGKGYYRCTKGNHATFVARGERPFPNAFAASTRAYQDFRASVPGGNKVGGAFCTTGSTEPEWGTVTGDVTVDGTVEWTLEYKGGLDITYPSPGGVFTPAHTGGYGFDPAGLCQRLHEAMQAVDADEKIIYICNGQSDLGSTMARYSSAIQSIATYFLQLGYKVMIGLTMFKPDATNAVTNYNTLQSGVADAITTLQGGTYGDKVFAGADLYANMGTTGPMGGWSGTGAISGGTLTVSATTAGALAVGQTVYDGTTPVGTVASGSDTTWTLTGASERTSRALKAAGVFLQYDLTHLSGAGVVGPDVAGVSCAGKYVSDALKALLPQRRAL